MAAVQGHGHFVTNERLAGAQHPGQDGLEALARPAPCFLPLRAPVSFAAVPPTPPADPTRIRLASGLEVNYWCQTLNCTETRLRNAVLAVGPLAADVRAYLAR